jgi:hypothetical protein
MFDSVYISCIVGVWMVIEQRGIPLRVVDAAKDVLKKYGRREIAPRKFVTSDAESLPVGRRYRLYRKSSASEWMLMSHERYNIFASGRRV